MEAHLNHIVLVMKLDAESNRNSSVNKLSEISTLTAIAPFSITVKAGDDMDILRNGKIIEFQLNNERTLGVRR